MNLRIEEVTDPIVRDNFQRIEEGIKTYPFLKGTWRFVEIEFSGAIANFNYRHGLGFIPKDVIQTSLVGSGAITWYYDQFSRDNVVLTSTGPCIVRAFIGSYTE